MEDLLGTVDWSRGQFALTAMVHWLFVPLTIGLSLIVAIMESVYLRTRSQKWLQITKFWMLLFGINFACGVATGLVLEFEFGTNWSNYSWFVGDIFGAPLAIEGIVAFFLESTFVAVMFFGWKRVSPRAHLTATWLTAAGVCLSAYWILAANAWMQYPVGMEFDPAQMRNVMRSFWEVALSGVAVNKFLHTVFSGWVLGSVFVVGVSCFLLARKKNAQVGRDSVRVAAWTGTAGILLTIWTGDGSAVEVARTQPMKLAAMEALYNGQNGEHLVAFGILDHQKVRTDERDPMAWGIKVPHGLSVLAKHDPDAFIPGINDLIEGRDYNAQGQPVPAVSYAQRIAAGKRAQQALRDYDAASRANDSVAMAQAQTRIKDDFHYFGYGYFQSPDEAVPPVAITFYSFRIMVIAGGYLLLLFLLMLFFSYRRVQALEQPWVIFLGLVSIPVVWIASEAGWVVAEMGRQPWVIQDLLPTRAAVSAISPGSIQFTFWLFVIVFCGLIAAEVAIMCHQISSASSRDIISGKE